MNNIQWMFSNNNTATNWSKVAYFGQLPNKISSRLKTQTVSKSVLYRLGFALHRINGHLFDFNDLWTVIFI